MNNNDLMKLIEAVKVVGCKHFEEFANYTNQDHGNLMIEFFGEPGFSKKINDWGRDLDTDIYIGLSSNGWIKYTNNHEVGAGKTVFVDEISTGITNDDVIEMLGKASLKEFLNFMQKSLNIRNRYPSEFDRFI